MEVADNPESIEALLVPQHPAVWFGFIFSTLRILERVRNSGSIDSTVSANSTWENYKSGRYTATVTSKYNGHQHHVFC